MKMERVMKSRLIFRSFAVLMSVSFFANIASATTQTISASASNGNSTSGSANVASSAKVTCTQASGGGTSSRCYIQSPGWSGLLKAGQSIGTSGAGTVSLYCNGSYPVGGALHCSAQIDDTACSPEQTISASASLGNSTDAFAPIKSPAIVECTQASGGGTSSRCYIQSPGWTGSLQQGQSIGTSGAGTVSLSCNGSYPVGGALSCSVQIDQVCP